jgi:hypothetical protein
VSFQNATNRGRVEKMLEFLDLIEKSAVANKTPTTDVQDLLRPVLDRLYGSEPAVLAALAPVAVQDAPSAAQALPKPGSHALRNTIRELAETAELQELGVAMAVYATRIDTALDALRRQPRSAPDPKEPE